MTTSSKKALIESASKHTTQKDVILSLISNGCNSLDKLIAVNTSLPHSMIMSERSITARLSAYTMKVK